MSTVSLVPTPLSEKSRRGLASLVPRPPPQLSSLVVRITLRRPGENYHVMYATVTSRELIGASVNEPPSSDADGTFFYWGERERAPH